MKKAIIPILMILSILLFMPYASAYRVYITWNSNLEEYGQIVYHCNDSTCSDVNENPVFKYTTNTKRSVTDLNTNGNQYHAIYFYKKGYVPKALILQTWAGVMDSKNLKWAKKQDTKAEITSLILSTQNLQVGEPVTITASIKSPFDSSNAAQGTPEYVPPVLIEEHYSALTKVFISVVDSQNTILTTHPEQANILMDQSYQVEYKWVPEKPGNYKFLVTTEVIDNQVDKKTMKPQVREVEFVVMPQIIIPPLNAVIDSPLSDQIIYQGDSV
ncbi:MAG: hypothetical protein KKG60_01955, partial [Nanoarchaeota archaeon]|nr:hypothetical protein [Nanoarchaeota archaeon]